MHSGCGLGKKNAFLPRPPVPIVHLHSPLVVSISAALATASLAPGVTEFFPTAGEMFPGYDRKGG